MANRNDFTEVQPRVIACPRCDASTTVETHPGWQRFACGTCAAPSSLLAARVRASRSQGDKRGATRLYATRVVYGGTEDLIEFPASYGEFEMRAGDDVAFVTNRDRLYVVYNFTLRRYARLHKPFGFRWWRVALVLAVVAVFVALVALNGHASR